MGANGGRSQGSGVGTCALTRVDTSAWRTLHVNLFDNIDGVCPLPDRIHQVEVRNEHRPCVNSILN